MCVCVCVRVPGSIRRLCPHNTALAALLMFGRNTSTERPDTGTAPRQRPHSEEWHNASEVGLLWH